jgi:SAM-dependent methyltransferase
VDDHLTRQLATMAPHRAVLRAVECRLMGAVELQAPVLDLGCGDGHFAAIAYESPLDVGVDIRLREVREAAGRGPSVYRHLAAASATSLPFGDGSFATVVSNCAIEHMPEIDRVIGEITRVLRPGGAFVTTLPSEHFADMLLGSTLLRSLRLRRAAGAYGRWFNRISYHYHVDPPEVWRERLARFDLDVVEHCYYFSARAHRAFDASHYLSVPNLGARKLTGRWVLHPIQARPYERWLRQYYEEPLPQPVGAYQFLRSVKRA